METYSIDRTIDDTTIEHMGDLATDADVAAFKSACWNYQETHTCTDREAMDYIWNDGDFGVMIATWADDGDDDGE